MKDEKTEATSKATLKRTDYKSKEGERITDEGTGVEAEKGGFEMDTFSCLHVKRTSAAETCWGPELDGTLGTCRKL